MSLNDVDTDNIQYTSANYQFETWGAEPWQLWIQL